MNEAMAQNPVRTFEEAIKLAVEYQQNYYELLSDWLLYDSTNYEYIRHQVGYALFGLSKLEENPSNHQDDVFNVTTYSTQSCKVIDKIYQQIIKHGRRYENSPIYIGIIYNITILHQKLEKETNETKMHALPVFKIKHRMGNIWYIDNDARLYKDWTDYLQNNTLPKCTMVFPKDAIYQYNPEYEVKEYCSTVWIEILNSPACKIKKTLLSGLDIAANAMSLATVGLGAATLVTPVGPILMTAGLVTSAVSGIWCTTRHTQKLVDLSKHKQSISPINAQAFPLWLGIGGTFLSAGASGGSMVFSKIAAKAVAEGRNINNVAKVICSSAIIGNSIQGIGIAYESYKKYRNERKLDSGDERRLISEALFFGNKVIDAKTAIKLIDITNGTIFEKIKNILRFNRLKQQFKKFMKTSADDSEGIIYKLKKTLDPNEFLNSLSVTNLSKKYSTIYENGKIIINNMKLLDPMIFTRYLLEIGTGGLGLLQLTAAGEDSNGTNDLKITLLRLLKNHALDNSDTGQVLDINNFDELLMEMRHITNAKDILKKLFKISVIIVSRCNSPSLLIYEILYFLWRYCKANVKEYIAEQNSNIDNKIWIFRILTKIITCVFDYIDTIVDDIFAAFYTYVSNLEKYSTQNESV